MKTIDIECPECSGTGIYVGYAEKDGAGVVCRQCEGSGKRIYHYTGFTGRKTRDDVRRVFESVGYVQSASDITTPDGVTLRFSRAGASYESWLKGTKPEPVKDLYCPYIWVNQNRDSIPESLLCGTDDFARVILGKQIKKCEFWKTKSKCWEAFDAKEKK